MEWHIQQASHIRDGESVSIVVHPNGEIVVRAFLDDRGSEDLGIYLNNSHWKLFAAAIATFSDSHNRLRVEFQETEDATECPH